MQSLSIFEKLLDDKRLLHYLLSTNSILQTVLCYKSFELISYEVNLQQIKNSRWK